jgi:hypothetical protein
MRTMHLENILMLFSRLLFGTIHRDKHVTLWYFSLSTSGAGRVSLCRNGKLLHHEDESDMSGEVRESPTLYDSWFFSKGRLATKHPPNKNTLLRPIEMWRVWSRKNGSEHRLVIKGTRPGQSTTRAEPEFRIPSLAPYPGTSADNDVKQTKRDENGWEQ